MFKGAVVVMGVASCGKTTVGQALAEHLGSAFTEGDKLHPRLNIEKMSAGLPLNDADRWPWLALIGQALQGEAAQVASCSALKKVYRQKIESAAGRPVSFIFLDGSKELLERRIAARTNHFMPPTLLQSQLQTLEVPGPDEKAKRFDIALPVATIVEMAAKWLNGQDGP